LYTLSYSINYGTDCDTIVKQIFLGMADEKIVYEIPRSAQFLNMIVQKSGNRLGNVDHSWESDISRNDRNTWNSTHIPMK